MLEGARAHGVCKSLVRPCLPPPHRLQRIAENDGCLTVGRRYAYVEGNSAIPPCRTGEYIGRAEARRGRKEAESLGFNARVATAGQVK